MKRGYSGVNTNQQRQLQRPRDRHDFPTTDRSTSSLAGALPGLEIEEQEEVES